MAYDLAAVTVGERRHSQPGSGVAGRFPQVADGVIAHRIPGSGYVLVAKTYTRRGEDFISSHQFEVDPYLIDFIELCDGARSDSEIGAIFIERHGPVYGPMLHRTAREEAQRGGLVALADAPVASNPVRITGSATAFHPLHATIEIIETCNFRCAHCYYSSSPEKTGRLSLDQARRIMDQLSEQGVRVVEITGGECTIHPQFREILAYAAQRFDLIALISNGYRLGSDPELLDYVASFPSIIVQISIDGVEEHHDVWRKHKNSYKMATRALTELSRRGIPTRMASALSMETVDDIHALYSFAKEAGVSAVAFTAVAAIGRGCNVSDPGAGSREIVNAINERLAIYGDDPMLNYVADPPEGVEVANPVNCGAGSRTFAIDYNGDVRACNYSRQSKAFGNVLTDDYDEIFGQEANFRFRAAPSPGGEECRGCDYYHNCIGCFVKAFMVSETEYPECAWRKKWFGDMSLAKSTGRVSDEARKALLAQRREMEKPRCSCGKASGCSSH